MTRGEHLDWCKQRALAYCDNNDLPNALASLGSDLGKHPETAGHAAIQLGMLLLLEGHLNTPQEMRTFIDGVH